MDLNKLRTSLEALGRVDFCGYNDEDESSLIVMVDEFNGDVGAFEAIKSEQITPTYPITESENYYEPITRMKGFYLKTRPTRSH